MNLLEDLWLPIRRRNGRRDWVSPCQLADPEIVSFDADRADFNGALMQFAIGLLQTTTPVDSPSAWRQLLNSPPDEQQLREWFSPVVAAFALHGDGPRFMQDFELRAGDGVINPVAALLIESPGENALRNNSDHFVKRGRVDAMCPACTATALFTLQTNAPAGGVGYRTGLRGGGPLTTLLLKQPPRSLWQDLWLNVLERSLHLSRSGDASNTAPHFRFPWLAEIEAIQPGSETAPAQVHPDQVFWAMPRRIRLDLEGVTTGECDVCGRTSDKLIRQFVAKNYGLNYKGAWDHPLSPYYEVKGEWLPLHPQPGGVGYRHWLAWVLGTDDPKNRQRSSRVTSHALDARRRQMGGALRIWAFGYDMDNMKARCWYESSLPLYGLDECDKEAIQTVAASVASWLAGAQLAASYLRGAVKDAWFGGDARGDFSAVDAELWGRTEAAFYRQLKHCIEMLREDEAADPDELGVRQSWHTTLVRTACELFDNEFVGTGQIERQKPRRIAEAHRQLINSLFGPKMCAALRLPTLDKPKAKRGQAAKATA
jgi:CRISPR system Cascade subunit CasA